MSPASWRWRPGPVYMELASSVVRSALGVQSVSSVVVVVLLLLVVVVVVVVRGQVVLPVQHMGTAAPTAG